MRRLTRTICEMMRYVHSSPWPIDSFQPCTSCTSKEPSMAQSGTVRGWSSDSAVMYGSEIETKATVKASRKMLETNAHNKMSLIICCGGGRELP